MKVRSTRGGVADLPLADALLGGTAPDGGLFVPERLPAGAVRGPGGATLAASAVAVLAPFFAGDRLEAALASMVEEAFAFPAPLVPLRNREDLVLELFHGPTAAFKDFGARFLAACMRRLHLTGGTRTVLVATSGDTGAAVAAAFHRMEAVRVVLLYPDGRVSPRQAHQLGAFGENVSALRVAGAFDDCQRMVKAAFADPELAPLRLTSANSISLGRLLPQMAYHAHAAWSSGGTLNLVVPTGNLGNALAAVWARELGAPIGDIVLATNANRTLSEFFEGAAYRGRPSVPTLANAMDVGDPSNFERL
ncbi:MAG TPA: threonine synthase, partial [Myxococcaceae bacterium]